MLEFLGKLSVAIILVLAGAACGVIALFGTVPTYLDDYDSSVVTRVGLGVIAAMLFVGGFIVEFVDRDKIQWSTRIPWLGISGGFVAAALTLGLTVVLGGGLDKIQVIDPPTLSADQIDSDLSAEIVQPQEEVKGRCAEGTEWIERNLIAVVVNLNRSPTASWLWVVTQTEAGMFPKVVLRPQIEGTGAGTQSWWNTFDIGKLEGEPYEAHFEELLIVAAGPEPSRVLSEQLFGGGLQQLPSGSKILTRKGICLQ